MYIYIKDQYMIMQKRINVHNVCSFCAIRDECVSKEYVSIRCQCAHAYHAKIDECVEVAQVRRNILALLPDETKEAYLKTF